MSRIMSLSPLQRYEQAISTGEFTRDEQQYQAMSYLDELYHQLNDSVPQKKRFFSFLKSKPAAPIFRFLITQTTLSSFLLLSATSIGLMLF